MNTEVTKKAIPNLYGKIKQVPRTDTTLTKEGYSADAKTVGDKFAEHKLRIDNIDPHFAKNVGYDNASSKLNAANVQAAIDKVSENVANIFTTKRPTGSYTGDGSATSRTINVGGTGGWLGVCSGSYIIGIITQNGAMFFNTTNSAVKCFPVAQAKYMSGVLTISSADDLLNKNGSIYHYQVL